jgi:DNA-directed RNA polymerase I subunit RPA49
MDSDPEDTKSQLTQNDHTPTPTKKKKKNKHRTPQPPPPPSPPVQAKVQVLADNPKKSPPLVGYFPSGYDPTKRLNSEENDDHDSTRVRVYRNQQRPGRVQVVVTPTGSNVDFVGSNYTGEPTAGQQCRYALGVFDKETQTLKIVPVACDKVKFSVW